MKKRDLPVDLERLTRDQDRRDLCDEDIKNIRARVRDEIMGGCLGLEFSYGVTFVESNIAREWLERAIEAEALVGELVGGLEWFFNRLKEGNLVEPEPSHWLQLEMAKIAQVYHKAKEELDDARDA